MMTKNRIKRQKVRVLKQLRRKKRKGTGVVKNMSDAARLFRVVFMHVREQMSAMLPENQTTLAMLITGILRSRNGQFQ
jgi:hypothetical protein